MFIVSAKVYDNICMVQLRMLISASFSIWFSASLILFNIDANTKNEEMNSLVFKTISFSEKKTGSYMISLGFMFVTESVGGIKLAYIWHCQCFFK